MCALCPPPPVPAPLLPFVSQAGAHCVFGKDQLIKNMMAEIKVAYQRYIVKGLPVDRTLSDTSQTEARVQTPGRMAWMAEGTAWCVAPPGAPDPEEDGANFASSSSVRSGPHIGPPPAPQDSSLDDMTLSSHGGVVAALQAPQS